VHLATANLFVNVVQLVAANVNLVKIVMPALATLASVKSAKNVLVMSANVLIVNVMGNLNAAKRKRLLAAKKRKPAAARKTENIKEKKKM